MKTKILLGSLLTVFLLMMLPSTSALQTKNNITEKTEDQDLPGCFPLLYLFFNSVWYFRLARAVAWSFLAVEGYGWYGEIYNEDSFAYKRAMFLLNRAAIWGTLWYKFGERVDWW